MPINKVIREAGTLSRGSVRHAGGMGTVFEAHSHKLTQRARRDDPSAFRAVHDAVSHRIEELGGAGTNRQRILYAADLAAAEAVLRRVINTEDRIALRYFWDELLES